MEWSDKHLPSYLSSQHPQLHENRKSRI